jgi:3-oxoacyl-[acyl-carrier-protein] synthase-3
MYTSRILAAGHYVPERIVTNAELCQMMNTTNEWIVTRCGVSERRILKDKDKASAFMAAEAATKLLAKKKWQSAAN